jgi:two-component system chemotaxis response regulator CheB
MIRILIVDDSTTEVEILKAILRPEKDFEVVGVAKDGKQAIEMTQLLKPDLITMDIIMPGMSGFEAINMIMRQCPTPIVVITSTISDESMRTSFQALEAGAVSVLEKPYDIAMPEFQQEKRKIIDTLRSMSQVKVIKRRFYTERKPKPAPVSINKAELKQYEIIAMGASVGGPQALKTILKDLPANFPLPIVVVQHMTAGFVEGFASWLHDASPLHIKTAENNEVLLKGNVYFAPDGTHLEVARSGQKLIAKLVSGEAVSGFCPSVTSLFDSVANVVGKNAIGVLLTGMGNDGAKGMLDLKNVHAHTIIQDEESAVVFGMAGVALSLNAVDKVIALDQIAEYLKKLTM